MDRKEKSEKSAQEQHRVRDWERSEWFRKWLDIIRHRTPQPIPVR